MNLRREIFAIIAIILFCTILSSCITRNAEWSNLQTSTYKQETNSSSGQLAAVYKERIYFAAAHDKSYGIYSMNFDGTDLHYEFATEKIIKILLTDDDFYYIGLSYVGKARDERYSLYKYNLEKDEAKLLEGDGRIESIQNAIVTNDGEIILRTIGRIGASKAPSSKVRILSEFVKNPISTIRLTGIDSSNYYELLIFDDYIVTLVDYELNNYSGIEGIKFDNNDAVYSMETREALMWQISEWNNCNFKVVDVDKENIYIAYSNEFIALDRESLEEVFRIKLSAVNGEQLDYALERKAIYYLITAMQDDTKKLYKVDMETLDFEEIMTFDEKKVLINIIDGYIIYAEANEIYSQVVNSDGIGEINYTIDFEKNIVDNSIFEIAGNWLFIYDRGKPRETGPLELLYRINLQTEEVIEN